MAWTNVWLGGVEGGTGGVARTIWAVSHATNLLGRVATSSAADDNAPRTSRCSVHLVFKLNAYTTKQNIPKTTYQGAD
jgi:hypothetical protein